MIPVSAAWQQAIREQFRYQGYLEMVIRVTPPGLQEGISVDTVDSETDSFAAEIVDDRIRVPTAYASFEPKRWRLNKKYKVKPDGVSYDDWWSTPINNGFKTIVFDFDKVYSFSGIYVEWDVLNKTYPSDITLVGYTNLGDKKYEYVVQNIDSYTGFVSAPMDDVKSVTLNINKWSKSNWRARINRFMFGEYIEYSSENNGRIISSESVDSSSIIGNELPVHTMTVELRNIDKHFDPSLQTGVSKYLSQRQLVKYRWGFVVDNDGTIEWTPQLNYYVSSFSIPEDSKNVSIVTTSRLDFLKNTLVDKIEYTSKNINFYELATRILEQSNIVSDVAGVNPWVLDERLKNYVTNAPIPSDSVSMLLEYIANAASMRLFVDTVSGYVCIGDTLASTVQEVSKSQELGDPKVEVQEQLHTIKIGVYNYAIPNSEKQEIGRSEYVVDKRETITLTYSCEYAVNVTCTVSGATLVSFEPYSSSAIITIEPDNSNSNVIVVLNGNEVKKSVTYIETYRDATIDTGLEITVDNPLITNTDKLSELTNTLLEWYKLPHQLVMQYTGYPELTSGDSINLDTEYSTGRVIVNKHVLKYNGGFSGTIYAR